ncbi:MAG: hypothetical protein HY323_08095 [Betaproteobacteria bacterium]|nr:hypothetical protein [Betaproteobacteria bacterium]
MPELNTWAQFGFAAAVAGYLLLRIEPALRDVKEALATKMDTLASSLDRVTRAMLIEVLTRPNISPAARNEAQSVMNELVGGQRKR